MKSTIPAPAAQLLDFIAGYESHGNYSAYFGKADNTAPLPSTLDDVLRWQADFVKRGNKSSAIGKYQFMPKTLKDLMKNYGIQGSERFTPDLQDELAFYLLVRRGYNKWLAGTYSDGVFADHLSMEWASMPYQTGKSYYDSSLNHSLVSRAEFMSVIKSAKSAKAPAPVASQKAPEGKSMEGLLGTVASLIEGTAGKAGMVMTVAKYAPGIAAGAFKSIDEVERGLSDLFQLATDIREGKWDDVEGSIERIMKEFRQIMENFGIVHDDLNTATLKVGDTDSVATLKAKA